MIDILTLLIIFCTSFVLAQRMYAAPQSAMFTADTPTAMWPGTGFYEPEQLPDQTRSYRWTRGSARLTLPNPGGAPLVRLGLAGGPARSVPLQFRLDDWRVTFTVAPEPRIYHILLPPSPHEAITAYLDSPIIDEPGGKRMLGVVVSQVAVVGGGAAPRTLVVVLVLVIAALYGVVWLLTRRGLVSSGVALALLTLIFLWREHGGSVSALLFGSGATLGLIVAAIGIPQLAAVASGEAVVHSGRRRSIEWLLAPSALAMLRQAGRFWRAHAKIPLLMLLAATASLIMFMGVKTQFGPQDFGLDQSWFLELENQLRLGHLMGRDSFFTYGPLAQIIASAGMLLRGSAPVLAGSSVDYLMFDLAGIALITLALLLIPQVHGLEALLIFSVCFLLNGITSIRQGTALLSMVALARMLEAPRAYRRWLSIPIGLLWFAGQLLTTEIGVYSVAAGFSFLLLYALLALPQIQRWTGRADLLAPRAYIEVVAIAFTTLLLCNLAMELFFRLSSASYEWFDYARYMFAIVTAYNYTMGIPWDLNRTTALVLLFVYVYVTISWFAHFKRAPRDLLHLFTGLTFAALISVKSVIVRSEAGHMMLASTVIVFLFTLTIALSGGQRLLRFAGATLLVLLVLAWPSNRLRSIDLLAKVATGEVRVSDKWQEVRSIAVNPDVIAPPNLRKAVDPTKQLVDFPYDNVLAIALNQPSLAPILQTYSAHNLLLQDKYVRDIDRQRANVEIIYGIDGMDAGPLDDVQNVTRIPVIFQYIAEHFRLKTDQVFKHRYVVLMARDRPRPLQFLPLDYTARSASGATTINLAQPLACGMIQIDLTIDYPISALAGRPRGLVAQVHSGGSVIVENTIVALEPGRSFSTLLYLGHPADFPRFFGDGPIAQAMAPFDSITLTSPPASLFDVHPRRVTIDGLRCAR